MKIARLEGGRIKPTWPEAVSLSPDRVEVVVSWLGQIVVVLPHAGHGGDE